MVSKFLHKFLSNGFVYRESVCYYLQFGFQEIKIIRGRSRWAPTTRNPLREEETIREGGEPQSLQSTALNRSWGIEFVCKAIRV